MKSSLRLRSLLGTSLLVCVILAAGCSWVFPAKYKLRAAQELEAAGNYEEAVVQYEEVARDYRGRSEAVMALSRAAALYEGQLKNWQKAAVLLQELRTLVEGTPEAPQVLLRLARILEQSGSPYTDSLTFYKLICTECVTEPEGRSALLAQGRIYESMQRWDDAKRVYEEAIAYPGLAGGDGPVRARLQSVWLLEALGAYFGGQVDEGVRLAQEALEQELIVPEVKQGLEDLLRRHRLAKNLWRSSPETVFVADVDIMATPEPSSYVFKAERSQRQLAPEGWQLDYNQKRKSFRLTEKPPVSATDLTAGTAKRKSKARKKKLWSYTNPSWSEVLGLWWSPDGRYLGWAAKSRKLKTREFRVLDLKTRKAWRITRDSTGLSLGETMLFLPRAGKLVFPTGKFLVVSNLRGGNRVQLLVKGNRKLRATYRARKVDWLACSADGIELTVAVSQPVTKKSEEPRHMYWKFNLLASYTVKR